MAYRTSAIIHEYAKMWPREFFYIKRSGKYDVELKDLLTRPGVYVLYRDDQPYYIGKASKKLFSRLRRHAVNPKDPYYNFWNFFSAFVVSDAKSVDDVEGILIASMPTDNRALPRFRKIPLPKGIASFLKGMRTKEFVDNSTP